MPNKLIITIEEQSQKVGGETLMGYAVLVDADPGCPEESLIPVMAPLLTKVILRAITLIHTEHGATLHKEGLEDRETSLESLMAEQAAKLESPFPSEIET